MRTIGIRAAPTIVTFAIYDTEAHRVLNVEAVRVPAALNRPEALKYIRSTVLDILREYDVRQGCLRIMESTAQSSNMTRIQIEGVIQECFASSNLNRYCIGQIASISSRLGIDRVDFKPLIAGTKEFDRVDNWEQFDECQREAILAALGAENA
jgi:hypothetical protein